MTLRICDEPIDDLADYATIPIRFEVVSVFDVTDLGREWSLTERRLPQSYVKDYDALEAPTVWPRRFDVSAWRRFSARAENMTVGGAVVAVNTPGVHLLEGRSDLAVLWDIRVHPAFRRHGIGTGLFEAAAEWSAQVGCLEMKIETQNINVSACRFYSSRGCRLSAVRHHAYWALPQEIQLIWSRRIIR
jgi:GNAT superfamily N-acetyltransferase